MDCSCLYLVFKNNNFFHYTCNSPPGADNIRILRVVVREDFTMSRCEILLKDIKIVIDKLNRLSKKSVDIISPKKNGWALYKDISMASKDFRTPEQVKKGRTHGIC